MHISFNGNIITEEKAYIHIKDRGFLLGDGLFETCQVKNGQMEFFDGHYERLAHTANALIIPFDYKPFPFKKMCMDLIKINKMGNESASIRITLTRDIGLCGINLPEKPEPTLLITTAPFHTPALENPIRAMITNITRNPSSPITKFKTLNYLEPILVRQEAQENGFDEGIMLNTDGYITECSVANIFMIKNNEIITPSIESGILPGIMWNHVITICHNNGYQVFETPISIDDIMNSESVFQTNSLVGVQTISQINTKHFHSESVIKIAELIAKNTY